MKARAAAEVLALMRGSWPNLAQDEVADRLWLEDLMTCDEVAALKTFRWLRDNVQFPPSWAEFLERYYVDSRPSINEQIAYERERAIESGPRQPTMSWQEGQAYQAQVRERQREARVMERIKNRPPFTVADNPIEPLEPPLTYEEVYETKDA